MRISAGAAGLATLVATPRPHCRRVEHSPGPKSTAAERSLRARIAAYALHATRDPRVTTKPARDAFMARFERQVDPEGRLPEADRQQRAEAAKKAYFNGLALKSASARRARSGGTGH